MSRVRHGVFAAILAALGLSAGLPLAAAQGTPPQAVDTGPPPIKLEFERGDDLGPGAVAVAHGTTSAEPSRFWVNGLGINQPVAVAVAADPAVALRVSLHKFSWDDALRSGETSGPRGTVGFELRTQGEVGVKVTAPDGSAVPFTVTIWAGDEVLPDTVEMLKPVADYSRATVDRLGNAGGAAEAAAPAAPAPDPTSSSSGVPAQPGGPPAAPAASGIPQWLLWGGLGGGAITLLLAGALIGRLMGRKGGNRS